MQTPAEVKEQEEQAEGSKDMESGECVSAGREHCTTDTAEYISIMNNEVVCMSMIKNSPRSGLHAVARVLKCLSLKHLQYLVL